MPKFVSKRWHGMHHMWALVLLVGLTVALAIYQWQLGLVGLLLTGALAVYTTMAERAFRREMNTYLGTLSYRVKKAGTEVINELPFGILLYNEERIVEWHNPFVSQMLDRDTAVGEQLMELFPTLQGLKDKDKDKELHGEAFIGDQVYEILVKPADKLLYVWDNTRRWAIQKKYDEERLALGIVMLDNLEEVTQGMDDQQRSALLSRVTVRITEWGNEYGLYLRRLASDRHLIITDYATLKRLELSRFDILDEIREMTHDQKIPMTLSVGFASCADTIIELGQWMQSSLDIALGRGGDQAAVKVSQRQTFYGGKSGAVEKRTRVRARVIAHALRDLIRESDNVVIMGHKLPDMDSIGAAIGVMKAARLFGKEAHIVLEGVNPSIQKMMDWLRNDEDLIKRFVTPDQAFGLIDERTLTVVVDTHKASMLKEPRLIGSAERIVIVDHHRRGEEFIANAVLIYMEPYASSTCELVTELLQYIHDRVALDVTEATALMAGIAVDTKNFSQRTGARTFEAASFLRRNGADTNEIQRMLKEELDEFVRKAEIIRHAEMVYEHAAIAVTEPGTKYTQLLIAQAADTLLNMNNVKASFVVGERTDGLIGVSARSSGAMNVQIVMERMGGGGHLTNAAAQMEGTVQEVAARLRQVLDDIDKEEGLFE